MGSEGYQDVGVRECLDIHEGGFQEGSAMTSCVVLDKVLSFSGSPSQKWDQLETMVTLPESMATPCHSSSCKEELRIWKEPWPPKAADSLHRWRN